MWINRTLCEVFDEMRMCYKTRNFAPLLGLIEEAQIMANRMEAKLGDIDDLEEMEERYPRMRREYNKLVGQIRKAKSELEED